MPSRAALIVVKLWPPSADVTVPPPSPTATTPPVLVYAAANNGCEAGDIGVHDTPPSSLRRSSSPWAVAATQPCSPPQRIQARFSGGLTMPCWTQVTPPSVVRRTDAPPATKPVVASRKYTLSRCCGACATGLQLVPPSVVR